MAVQTSRFRHFRMIVLRPIWAWLVTGVLAFVSLLAFLRDEFLPAESAAEMHIPAWAPHWPWYWWALILGACLLAVVVEGSYRAYLDLEGKLLSAKEKLEFIGLERTLDYVHMDFNIQRTSPAEIYVTMTLHFRNSGDKALSYRVTKAYATVNGVDAKDVKAPTNDTFISAYGKRTFGFRTVQKVPFNGFPIIVYFGYEIEYDNIPPIKVRTMTRDIEQKVVSIDPPVMWDVVLNERDT